MPKKKPQTALKIFLAACFIAAIIGICIPKKKAKNYTTTAGTLERTAEDIFTQTIDERILNIKKSYHSLKNNSECFIIEINYMTIHSTQVLILDDAIKFLSKIFTDAQCNQIEVANLYPHSTLIDKYGKESVDRVAMLQLNRTTASKINWSNMNFDMLEKILTSEGVLWFDSHLTVK